jgi:AraC-like DNA-binding protein
MVSLSGLPKDMIETPNRAESADGDALSNILRSIRISGSLQFCFMPTGDWETDGVPRLSNKADNPDTTVPLHVLVEGTCWLKMDGHEERVLVAGDVIGFPFRTLHKFGVGAGGKIIAPALDLPPKPWRQVPILRYGEDSRGVRLLCGYLQCDAIGFRPLRSALPALLHARTRDSEGGAWLRATIEQIVAEVDRPRTGGLSMMERLTEVLFIELLRHQMISAPPGSSGCLAALADPWLGQCLSLIHGDPKQDWSVQELASAAGLSRSTLAERFETMLGTSPMRYVRDWRLYLASVALRTTTKGIAAIAHDAGYGTEAAFNRAFSRAYGHPPGTWRQNARRRPADHAAS